MRIIIKPFIIIVILFPIILAGCGNKQDAAKSEIKIPSGPPASGWSKPLYPTEIQGTYHYGILNLLTIQPVQTGVELRCYGIPSSYSQTAKIHQDRLVFTIPNTRSIQTGAYTFDSSRNHIYLQTEGNENNIVGTRITSDTERQAWLALLNKQYEMASTLIEEGLLNQPGNDFLLWAKTYLLEISGEFEVALKQYKELVISKPNPIILPALYRGIDSLNGRIASLKNQNAMDYYAEATVYQQVMLNPPPTISSIIFGTILIDSSNMFLVEEYLKQYEPMFDQFILGNQKPVCLYDGDYLTGNPSFFPQQLAVQHWMMKGQLNEFQDNYESALDIYTQIYRMGIQLNQGLLSQRKFSVEIRSKGMNALSSLIQKPLPVETMKKLKDSVSRITQKEKEIDLEQLWNYELIHLPSNITRTDFDIYFKTIRIRERLLIYASAVKLFAIERNKFPKSESDIIPRYLSGIPPDYFTGTGLKFISTDTVLTLYSVGPDLEDDLGKIIYNPKNGIASKGDIIFSLKR